MEWGAAGMRRLAASDIVVLVDVFDVPGPRHPLVEAAGDVLVLAGGLRNAAAVARRVLDEQTRRAARTSVALIAMDADGRFAVENQLGAGAVVAALGDLGIDHSSPEAAVAGEGFRALRGAARHLLTASGTGRAMIDRGERDAVLAAAERDATSDVPELRRPAAAPAPDVSAG